MKQIKPLLRLLCTATAASVMALIAGQALAQAIPGTPKIEQPGRGGGGMGIGINIDLGSVFNAIKNAAVKNQQNKDDQNKPPVLQKTAVTVSAGASGSYSIDWVVEYANNTGATLPNVLIKDGPIATIINPSLVPGLVPQQGWTGTTNGNAPVDNYALFSGTNIAPHGVMTATFPPPGVSSPPVVAGHDGYIPIPYNSTRFGPRVYMFNHGKTTGANFQCGDASGSCPGWPKSAPVGDNSGETFQSFSGLNEEFGIVNGRIYYPVNKASNFTFGIACFDLEAETECGYTPVGRTKNLSSNVYPNAKDVSGTSLSLATAANLADHTVLKGPWVVGSELYLADFVGNVYCAKAGATVSPCLANYFLPSNQIRLAMPTYDPSYARSSVLPYASNQYVSGKVANGKLFFTTTTRVKHDTDGITVSTPVAEGSAYINCLNLTTKAACWNTPAPSGSPPSKGTGPHTYVLGRNGGDNGITMALANNFIYYDASGAAKAVCQYLKTGSSSFGTNTPIDSKQCFDLNTGAVFTPGTEVKFINPPSYHGYGTEVHVWPRTFFPDYATTDVHCWNWQTSSSCDSATKKYFAKTLEPVPSGEKATFPRNYALNVDENQCVWAYGDAGFLWNFDPNKLDADGVALPCKPPGKFAKMFEPLKYCSGPKPFHWTSFEVKGTALANYDKLIVKVLDSSNNTVLFSKDLKSAGQLLSSITGVDAQTLSKPLKIEVEYALKPGMGASDKPYLEVHYSAPPIEFCFKSTHSCQQSKITNIVETPDPLKQGAYISVKVDVDKPQSCPDSPPPPVCGQPGQPPCPVCGTVTTPACPVCGQPGQPACETPKCDQPGQPRCRVPVCGEPGLPSCPCASDSLGCTSIWIGGGCKPGDPLCGIGRPPPKPVCLTGDCAPKAEQTTAQEFKEPKVACVRKAKPIEAPVAAAKPRPKPVVAAAPPAPVDPNAPPKPKPKPRPKPAAKPAAHGDDCE